MPQKKTSSLIVRRNSQGQIIARIVEPNLETSINSYGEMHDTKLFKDLDRKALQHLREGEQLILNLGMVERCPSMLYKILLTVHHAVKERKGEVLLSNPSPIVRELLTLCRADQVFRITETENEAIRLAS